MKKNRIKPTEKQLSTFKHLKSAETLRDAMLAAGYSKATSTHPKQNFIDSKGFKSLVEQYRHDLVRAGFSTEMMAEIQVEGLTDQDPKVRLEYIKETKRDIGLVEEKPQSTQVNIFNQSEFIKQYDNDS